MAADGFGSVWRPVSQFSPGIKSDPWSGGSPELQADAVISKETASLKATLGAFATPCKQTQIQIRICAPALLKGQGFKWDPLSVDSYEK